MSNLSRMMQSLLGKEPYAKLCKAVEVEDGGYLASWVAARALLSWYRGFTSSLGKGEAEYRALPGSDDALVYVERDGDSYLAQVVKGGEVTQEFKHDQTSQSQLQVARAILTENKVEADLSKGGEVPGPEALEKIGEIVDKLVKIEVKKVDGDKQEVREDLDPEETYRNLEEARLKDPSVEAQGRDIANLDAEEADRRLSGDQKRKKAKKDPGGDKSFLSVDTSAKKKFEKQELNQATLADASSRQRLNFGGKKAKKPYAKKSEPLSKPPVSEAQRRAMHAAASGHSTLGIPKSVGKEFSDADKPGKLPEKVAKGPSGSLQAKPRSMVRRGGLGGGARRTAFWKHPGGTSPRGPVGGASDAMRSVDMQTGKYKMHGPKGNLPKSEVQKAGEKGVHEAAYLPDQGGKAGSGGVSVAGHNVRHGDPARYGGTSPHHMAVRHRAAAKEQHTEKLKELRSMPKPNLPKKEIEKAGEMPSGAGMPKQPKMPKPPVPAGGAPKAQASKQAQMSATGKQAMPKAPSAPKPPPQPKIGKSQGFQVSEAEVYAPCHHCGVPEFVKSEDGPKFSPCACFVSETEAEDGAKKKFVELVKGQDGKLKMVFDPAADPEAKKLFLLLVKGAILAGKRFPNQEG